MENVGASSTPWWIMLKNAGSVCMLVRSGKPRPCARARCMRQRRQPAARPASTAPAGAARHARCAERPPADTASAADQPQCHRSTTSLNMYSQHGHPLTAPDRQAARMPPGHASTACGERTARACGRQPGLRTKRPSQEAVTKSELELVTSPKPWLASVITLPSPTVTVSAPTVPVTSPVPYVMENGRASACAPSRRRRGQRRARIAGRAHGSAQGAPGAACVCGTRPASPAAQLSGPGCRVCRPRTSMLCSRPNTES